MKQKAEKFKDAGDPISLPDVPIDIKIRGDYAWVSGSAHVARKVDLNVRAVRIQFTLCFYFQRGVLHLVITFRPGGPSNSTRVILGQ